MTARLTVFAMMAILSCPVLAGINAAAAQDNAKTYSTPYIIKVQNVSCEKICHGIECFDFPGCSRGCTTRACSKKRDDAVKGCLRSCERSDGRRRGKRS